MGTWIIIGLIAAYISTHRYKEKTHTALQTFLNASHWLHAGRADSQPEAYL